MRQRMACSIIGVRNVCAFQAGGVAMMRVATLLGLQSGQKVMRMVNFQADGQGQN